jgi:hypothetical protein
MVKLGERKNSQLEYSAARLDVRYNHTPVS